MLRLQDYGKFCVNLINYRAFSGVRHKVGGKGLMRKRVGTRVALGTAVVLASFGGGHAVRAETASPWGTVISKSPAQSPPETAAQPAAEAAKATVATSASVSSGAVLTSFQLTLSRGVPAEVFTLANPYRVIVDLPDVSFRLPDDAGRIGSGLITAFRFGQFEEGKARLVLDSDGPVKIAKAEMTPGPDGSVVLRIEMQATEAAAFGAGTGKPAPSPASSPRPEEPSAALVEPRQAAGKPIIMIDPGHGGIDPGAVGAGNVLEKNLVVEVARKVESALLATGRYDVVMTRTADVFISLDRRLSLSREKRADLFLSIHADSIEQAAQSVRGATVYTLSERASDAASKAMAEKENASDLLAGIDVGEGEETGEVRNILLDLMKRETANFSADFSRTLVSKLRKTVSLSRDPQRSAAFKVLKQTHAPSVLIELGYVSNEEDARLMLSPDWQKKVAGSIATAVDTYFEKRAAVRP